MASKASFLLLLSVVVLAPLPFGSVEEHWVAVWCALLAASVALADLRSLTQVNLRSVLLVLAAVGLLLVILVVQIRAPAWPPALSQGPLDPGILPQTHSPAGLAVTTPWISFGPALAFVMSVLATYTACSNPARAQRLLKAVALSGVGYAAYGIVSLLADPTAILWEEKTAYVGYLTGTFINRNTAATYFGSCAIVWLTLTLPCIKKGVAAHNDHGMAHWSHFRPTRSLVGHVACFLVCLVALFLTASRAGILLSGILLVTMAAMFIRRALPARSSFVLATAGVLLAATAIAELLGGLVAFRIAAGGLVDPSRWLTYKATFAALSQHAWLGTGLGTFIEVFPAYRPAELVSTGLWDHAHSTPLQLALELGVPFFVVTLVLWIYAFVRLLRGALSRRRGMRFPLAATGVLLLGTLHSTVDFSLQIPGYAIVFAAIVGCGLAQAQRPEEGREPRAVSRLDVGDMDTERSVGAATDMDGFGRVAEAKLRSTAGRGHRLRVACKLAFIAVAVIAVLWVGTVGVHGLKRSELAILAERAWSGENFRPETLERILANHPARPGGLCRSADESQALALIAFAKAVQTAYSSEDVATADRDVRVLEDYAAAGTACAPGRAWTWLLLFWARTELNDLQAGDLPLLWMSYQLAPHEQDLQQTRNAILLRAYYDRLPEAGQKLAIAEFRELVEAGYVENAAQTFIQASETLRSRLTQAVEELPEPKRQTFAKAVRESGLDIQIAGVADPTRSAWDSYLTGIDRMRSLLRALDTR